MLAMLTVFALVAVLVFTGIPTGMVNTVLAQGPGGSTGSGGSGSGGTGAGGSSGTGVNGANGANGSSATNFNGVAPNAANSVLLAPNESSAFMGAGMAAPASGFGVGVIKAEGYSTYSINTRAGLNLSCAAVRVYRVTPEGDLILHPSTCAGDVLSFSSVGSGHYVLYAFNGTGAQFAQPDVIRSQNGFNNQQNSANSNQSGFNNQQSGSSNQNGFNNAQSGSGTQGGTTGQNTAGSNQNGFNNQQSGSSTNQSGTTGQNTTGSSQSGFNNQQSGSTNQGGTTGQNTAGSNQNGFNNQNTTSNNQSGVNNSQSGSNNNNQNSSLLPSNESAGMMSVWRNSSVGGQVFGVVAAQGFTQYTINTRTAGNASCAFVSVYRVTENGDLIRHPSTCAGDMLSFTSVGTGHYVLFSFGNSSAAQNSAQTGFRTSGGSTGANVNNSSSANGSSNSSSSSNSTSSSNSSSSNSNNTSGSGITNR